MIRLERIKPGGWFRFGGIAYMRCHCSFNIRVVDVEGELKADEYNWPSIDYLWDKSLCVSIYGQITVIKDDSFVERLEDLREPPAEFGNNFHRTSLLDDPERWVRCKIAEYGNDAHRDILATDPHLYVRETVVFYADEALMAYMAVNDPDAGIRLACRECLNNWGE